jgi:hypothetical protein
MRSIVPAVALTVALAISACDVDDNDPDNPSPTQGTSLTTLPDLGTTIPDLGTTTTTGG